MLIWLLNKKTLFIFMLLLFMQINLGQDIITYAIKMEIYYTAFDSMQNNATPKLLIRLSSKEIKKIKVGDKIYLELHSNENECEPKIYLTKPQTYIAGEVIGCDKDYLFIKPNIDVINLDKEDNPLLTYHKDKTHILKLHFRCENGILKLWKYNYHETINRKPLFFK